ncbi:nuclease-related domain-containing protein [Desulfosudis oleivorans]|uniref:NERD domain protein n=1 Tax=Desulfosudis oleivorans (strain DSM 6200 / JCM 39069 / Hxd3) TaxID=96561 RepID=A8ZX46_DESOH|nr:nuclease-related domain-containing protein [Desulfosudis oleivorans]ABW66902.1 NERD domain protein [Desulfosudis oleivorans Hxd3]
MKSPLKDKPLRNPGESLDIELKDTLVADLLLYYVFACFMVLLAILEWWRWFKSSSPTPVPYTVVATTVILIAMFQHVRLRAKAKNLRLGRDSEKAVGQYLELLRETGAKVFHDIPGKGFNLDHVVIHETGIYVVETKALSKPDRGETRLVYNGENVLKNGLAPDRNPIDQVRAARNWLVNLLKESTGKKISARPVVVYPGWYIQPTAEAKSSDVWVLNPKALPAFIAHSKPQLSAEDVNLCAYHLGRYVRTEGV